MQDGEVRTVKHYTTTHFAQIMVFQIARVPLSSSTKGWI